MDLMQGYLKYGAEFKVRCLYVAPGCADSFMIRWKVTTSDSGCMTLTSERICAPTMHHVGRLLSGILV
jgi:hypothetical protein